MTNLFYARSLAVRIVMEEKSFDGRLCDLSRGGVGALISGEEPKNFALDRAAVLHICWPNEKEGVNSEISARVTWAKATEDGVLVGFAFDTLCKTLEAQIDRFLLDRIIQRNLDADE